MGRVTTTHFNPSLGVRYFVIDSTTGEKVLGKVLGPNDKKYLPIRSSRGAKPGEEFFKMMINGEVHKFLNSNLFPDCRSENGRYIFIGEKYQKNNSEKLNDSESEVEDDHQILEWISDEVKSYQFE